MWYVSSNRDETRYEDPDVFDVTRKPEHQAFGAGGRHFCLGTALTRSFRLMLLTALLPILAAGPASAATKPPSAQAAAKQRLTQLVSDTRALPRSAVKRNDKAALLRAPTTCAARPPRPPAARSNCSAPTADSC